MPSSCLLPQFFLSLMFCGHQIEARMPKKILRIAVFFPSCITQHDGKLCLQQTTLDFDLSDSVTNCKDEPIPTLIISKSLDIPAGGICSLLRNNWHSEREYTAGIRPCFPRLTRAGTAQAWQGDGCVPSLYCSQSTQHLSPSAD